MDERILGKTQEIVRKLYNLNDEYVAKTCNIKSNTVEIELSNGLISLKVKFPRSVIEDNLAWRNNE